MSYDYVTSQFDTKKEKWPSQRIWEDAKALVGDMIRTGNWDRVRRMLSTVAKFSDPRLSHEIQVS